MQIYGARMIEVLIVFGTRPEAIKMCPLIKQIKKTPGIKCYTCLTGQHKEMLEQVMNVFRIKEDKNLNIMSENQTLFSITSRVLTELEKVIDEVKPDIILVHGDTTTSFAAALSGFYAGIPVGHVEAGLRTYQMQSPFPEEFNRQAVDMITNLYFAPTEKAKVNLLNEGKEESRIFVTGNTVIDALETTVSSGYEDEILEWTKDSRMILLTAHRRENLGEPMRQMFSAVKRILEEFRDIKVVYPVHKSPKVRQVANEEFAGEDRIKLIEPLDVFEFHNYMNQCYLVMTDSGGIQEEAPSLGKPVLVLRDTTERPEGIEAGTLKLVGTKTEDIYQSLKKLLSDEKEYEIMSNIKNPYGDGKASERIVQAILSYFKKES